MMVDHHRVGGTTGASISAAVAAVEAHASSDHEMNRVLPAPGVSTAANSEAAMEQSRLPPLRQVCRSTVGVYNSEIANIVLRMKCLPNMPPPSTLASLRIGSLTTSFLESRAVSHHAACRIPVMGGIQADLAE